MSQLNNEIQKIKTELVQLGYHPDELEHIVHENVPSSKTAQSYEILHEELDFLQNFLVFASKSVGVR